ncbi:hypothetical protein BLNAU_1089 [Blattamonas nauphoetae]|uniref:Uncharacterized protein n=1 Tax=Blattamonas nauphoetae TaxID=2049346 RepID=A0ABQ9YJS4_9EUKA|nr:hypothetical protein BLNAU_1089 [Blattamonas nauphoetae]
MKLQPALDDSLEERAVKFLTSLDPEDEDSTEALLSHFASFAKNSLTDFIQSIVVLLSTPNLNITAAVMEILENVFFRCSAQIRLALVKADLIPQIINTLNPQSLSFTEAVDIHINIMNVIRDSVRLLTPAVLTLLGIEDHDAQQAVHETIFQQVLVPSKNYIWHVCVHRFSIIDGYQSSEFMVLLAQILRICPYHQPTMEFVLYMPVFLTIPSCLSFFETDFSIYPVMSYLEGAQQEWKKKGGEVRQIGKKIHRMLRMEGFEDVMEDKLQNNVKIFNGRAIIAFSIEWNNLLGMNLPEEE